MRDTGIDYTLTTPNGSLTLYGHQTNADGIFLSGIDPDDTTEPDVGGRGPVDGSDLGDTRYPGLRFGLTVDVIADSATTRNTLEGQLYGYLASAQRGDLSVSWTDKAGVAQTLREGRVLRKPRPVGSIGVCKSYGFEVGFPRSFVEGGSGLAESLPGVYGVTLNGVDQYGTVPYAAALNPSTFSIEAWITVDSTGAARAFMGTRNGNASGYLLYMDGSNVLWLYTYNGAASALNSGFTLAVGTLYHVVATYDGANSRIYVDGDLKAVLARTYTPNAAGILAVGAGGATPTAYHDGELDEAAVYSGALSLQRVQAHHLVGRGVLSGSYRAVVLEDEPVAWYRCHDGANPTVMSDSSGNGYHGSWVNSPTLPSATEYTLTESVALDDEGSGLSFDGDDEEAALPWSFADSGGGTLTVPNPGTTDEYPILGIDGPATSPVIVRTDTQDKIQLDTTIPSGSFAEVDLWHGTITLNGVEDLRYTLNAAESTFFSIPPGGAPLQLICSDSSGSTLLWARTRGAYAA